MSDADERSNFLRFMAVVYILFSLWGLLAPQHLAEVIGFGLHENSAHNEMRANYGGQFLLIGVFLLITSSKPSWFPAGYLFVALAMGGLALGRLVSIVLDGWPGIVFFAIMAAEIFFSALSARIYLKY